MDETAKTPKNGAKTHYERTDLPRHHGPLSPEWARTLCGRYVVSDARGGPEDDGRLAGYGYAATCQTCLRRAGEAN